MSRDYTSQPILYLTLRKIQVAIQNKYLLIKEVTSPELGDVRVVLRVLTLLLMPKSGVATSQ